jgi:hypothetical protein
VPSSNSQSIAAARSARARISPEGDAHLVELVVLPVRGLQDLVHA